MKIIKTKIVKSEYTDKIICDKCKQEIQKSYSDAFDCDFTVSINFNYEDGYHYDDNGSGKRLKLDFCETCANDIIDYFKKIGIVINMEEWDY